MTDQRGIEAQRQSRNKKALLAQLLAEQGLAHQPARIGRRDDAAGDLPLSFAQERLWFLDQFDPGSTAYTIPLAVRICGPLSPEWLRASLDRVVARHEALRTTFPASGGRPVQRVAPALAIPVAFADLSGQAADQRDQAARALLATAMEQPFDLASGPLLRLTLVRLAPEEHLLLLCMHHIISDGWSIGILLHELLSSYDALVQGRPVTLPELPIQYGDYAIWQRQWMQGEGQAAQLAYWQRQLAGAPPSLQLPADRPRPAEQTARGAREPFALPEQLAAELAQLGRETGTTRFMVLLAGYAIALSRSSGQTDLVVGTPVAGRTRTETEGLIGCFINTLVLRIDLGGSPTVREVLERVRTAALDAYAHQDVPFEKLVEVLQPQRDPSTPPLFQVMMALQHRPAPVAAQGLHLEALDLDPEVALFDLTLQLEEQQNAVAGWLEYNTDLYDRETVARFGTRLLLVLEQMAAHPARRVSDLALLSPEERHQILVGWNATEAALPLERGTLPLIAEQVARTPGAVAVVDGDRQLSYAELYSQALRLGAALRARGVGPETIVPVLFERGADLLITLLGIFAAGGAYLPLDPAHPPQRIRQLLGQSQAGLLLASRACAACLEAEDNVLWFDELLSEAHQALAPQAPAPKQLAYIFYTSGSTGQPKGVLIEHAGMLNHLLVKIEQLGLTGADTVAQSASQCFDISIWQLLTALLVGGRVVVLDDATVRDPQALALAVAAQGVSILQVVPSLLAGLLEIGDADARDALGRLRWLGSVGEALPPALARRWLERYPHVPILNAYGPTECTDNVTLGRIASPPPADASSTSIGRPVANMRAYVLDKELAPVPAGVIGDLLAGGVGISRGYLHDPVRTAAAFVPDPFAQQPGARLYRTGDLARHRPDGSLEFAGRADQQIKVRGYRIELGEIEAALGAHPAIRLAAVLVREDGAGQKQLVAYVAPALNQTPTAAALRAWLLEHLPEYMAPAAYVVLPDLPLTPNGKVNRRALPAPTADAYAHAAEAVPPRTPREEIICAIWAEALGQERVGVHDDFFALGGHSFLATHVVARIGAAFGIDLPLRTLFNEPTVARLALAIDSAGAQTPAAPPLVPADDGGDAPLSYAQERLWLLHQLAPDSAGYHISATVRLFGPLDHAALQRAFGMVAARHAVLRTTFHHSAGSLTQRVHAAHPLPLPLLDLSAVPPAQREHELRLRAEAAVRSPFDLAAGPLLRLLLVRLAREEHVLVLVMHHIIADGRSMDILFAELAACYGPMLGGQQPTLPALPVQYADYAAWQRRWLRGETLEAHLRYWTEQLGGAPPLLQLPTDRPRPAAQRFEGAHTALALAPELVQAVHGLARRANATPFMVLLAGVGIALARWSGQPDLVIGTVSANRTRREVEGLIGCFMNFLPLRAHVAAAHSGAELIGQVRSTLIDAAHQDCPFDLIVEALNPERSAAHNPIYNVGFLLQSYQLPFAQRDDAGLRAQFENTESSAAILDLLFTAIPGAEAHELTLVCEYRTDLFATATAEQVLAFVAETVAQLAAAPEATVDTYALPPGLAAQAAASRAREQALTIQVAATFTAEPIVEPLAFWMDTLDLPARIAVASYNQVFQLLLDPASALRQNTAGVNLVLVRVEDWWAAGEAGDSLAELAAEAFAAALAASSVPWLVALCPPSERVAADPALAARAGALEAQLEATLAPLRQVQLITARALAARYPVADILDPRSDALGHVPYTAAFFAALATASARTIAALRRPPYKVIVADCDNTLWRGVVGEDGSRGIVIEPQHRTLQTWLLAQQQRGMLICLCSHNHEADVLQVIDEHPDMQLRREHLAAWKINWQPKSQSIAELIDELGLGLESCIFLDDSPIVRADVRAALPQIATVGLPEDPDALALALEHLWAVDQLATTEEDRERTALYRQNLERERFRRESLTLASFLADLGLEVRIAPLLPDDIARVAQLTWRTNQFNLSTVRRSEAEIAALADAGLQCHTVSARDRFGDYGLIGVLIYRCADGLLEVDTMLLSCRALGRGIEHRMLAHLGAIAQEQGCAAVQLRCVPTAKNEPARAFLEQTLAAFRSTDTPDQLFRVPAAEAARIAYQPATAQPAPAAAPAETAPRAAAAPSGLF
ncbi:MAG TPA: amino acid adenylation domain-containing protein, partial [Roseiflexaceae bacterium]|nr:amino acid adenylation domain-containing protein [Roseiflexaceae bacterium]